MLIIILAEEAKEVSREADMVTLGRDYGRRAQQASILCKKEVVGFVFLWLVWGSDGLLKVFISAAQVLAGE